MVIQRSKYNKSASKGELLECGNDFKEEIDLFPPELLYHGEYHDELPMIERERERKAPQLSNNFLTRHINAEQRRLVVIFIIRLGVSRTRKKKKNGAVVECTCTPLVCPFLNHFKHSDSVVVRLPASNILITK